MLKTGVINTMSDAELQNVLDTSDSYVMVLDKLGLNPYTGNHRTLKNRILTSELDTTKLEENRRTVTKLQPKKHTRNTVDNTLIENCNKPSGTVRRLMLRESIIKYECSGCGLVDSYNGNPLRLQLDHINGDSKDNRVTNLRWLCPNCHSQTETFAGRNSKRYKNTPKECKGCRSAISRLSIYCRDCFKKTQLGKKSKIVWPEFEILITTVKECGFVQTGAILGVSANAVRRYLKRRGLDLKTLLCH